jgi:hypothetical protein
MKLTFLLRIAILAAAQMTKIEIYTFHSENYHAGYSPQMLRRHKMMNGRRTLDPKHIGSNLHNDVMLIAVSLLSFEFSRITSKSLLSNLRS